MAGGDHRVRCLPAIRFDLHDRAASEVREHSLLRAGAHRHGPIAMPPHAQSPFHPVPGRKGPLVVPPAFGGRAPPSFATANGVTGPPSTRRASVACSGVGSAGCGWAGSQSVAVLSGTPQARRTDPLRSIFIGCARSIAWGGEFTPPLKGRGVLLGAWAVDGQARRWRWRSVAPPPPNSGGRWAGAARWPAGISGRGRGG